jgi:hypothetical protein
VVLTQNVESGLLSRNSALGGREAAALTRDEKEEEHDTAALSPAKTTDATIARRGVTDIVANILRMLTSPNEFVGQSLLH